MKEKRLKIIVLFMTISVLGLIVIQFYWINKALILEEEKFNKNVGIALTEAVKLIEKNETANVLVKEISSSGENHILFLDKNVKKIVKPFPYDSNKVFRRFIEEKGDDNNVRIEVFADDDNISNQVQIISNVTVDDDTTVEETIMWHSGVDSLIHRKTKIIENVFDELIFTENNNSILNRIERNEVDSILGEELNKYGISTNYEFAISVEGMDSLICVAENLDNENLVSTSHKAKLFPYDVFSKPNYLLVDFKNKTEYFLSSIWWVLFISLLFTGLIIFLFYQTVKMLLKQKKITELKTDLLNNITHEFKTPISTISLAADVIGASSELKSNKYPEIIKTESKRLTNMVEDILSAAALENSEYELNREKGDIHKIINDVIEKFRLPLNLKEGEIITSLNASNAMLNIDKQHLFNTISNIIDNAIKYNNGAPTISISSADTNNAFEIIFEDNGIGIDSRNYSKIFETFYRVPTGNIHDVKGNGIGLSYVKKIVEAHGGTVTVESELNNGSKFIINLPKY